MPPRAVSLFRGLQSRPVIRDAIVAVFLALPGAWQVFNTAPPSGYRAGDALNLVLVLAVLTLLPLRRRFPFGVLCGVLALLLALAAAPYPATVSEVVAFLVAVYSVAAHRALSVSFTGGVIAVVVFGALVAIEPHDGTYRPVTLAINIALIGGVWWLGRSMRLRRAYETELRHRADRLERARDLDARAARVEERSRIARELHDVVAHHVSVMTVQAGAARRVIDKSPDAAREAMATIEETGRTALSEMRRIVGVLRTEGDAERSADQVGPQGAAAELAPQPGLHDVGGLIDHVRETGLSVQLWIEGEARSLPPGVNLAAYRLIQEALTNTLKHAGPQARAWVRILYGPGELTVQVEDDGRGLAAALAGSAGQAGPGGAGAAGHGMVGMYERVALYGGQLRIGPRSGGGFEVRARFPID